MKITKILSALAVSALLVSPSFAAEAPLPAGKPAGTKESALLGFSALTVAFVGGFAGLLIAAGSGAFSSKPVPASVSVSTSTTGTSS